MNTKTIALAGLAAVGLIAAGLVLSTPLVTWGLADGLPARGPLTAACGVFAAIWCPVLVRRRHCEDRAVLKRLRLSFRYSVIALGALAFATTLL